MSQLVAARRGPGRPEAGRRRGGARRKQHVAAYLFILPFGIVFAGMLVLPLVYSGYLSLFQVRLVGGEVFAGLSNYVQAFTDPAFGWSILYTLIYTGIVTLPILLLGYTLAVLVRSNRRGAKVLRTVFFIPYVIGLTTLSFLMVLEAQPDSGMVNLILKWIGLTDGSTAWLVDGKLGTILICALVVWGVSGLTMMLLMSGMQGIPTDVYESAELDGAGWWRTERHVTVPMLRRTIALCLIISVIGSFLAFTQFFILTQGGPGSQTTTVVMAIYKRAFVQLQLGAATAMSLLLVVIIGLVTAAQFWLLRERD